MKICIVCGYMSDKYDICQKCGCELRKIKSINIGDGKFNGEYELLEKEKPTFEKLLNYN